MALSNEQLGNLLAQNEEKYVKRSQSPFIPVTLADLKKMHDHYKEERGDDCLKSVWVDELTILHLAHFILTHKEGARKADGVRVYLEKFDKDSSVLRKTFKKGMENMAFMVTYSGSGADEHLDWLAAEQSQLGSGDKLAADNYNDPDPPKNTGSSL